MEVLKIYIIEDDIQRMRNMELQFEKYNEKMKNNESSKLGTFLKSENIHSITCQVIRPSAKENNGYYNYFIEDKNFFENIQKILQTPEKRIFILDLALNEDERDVFSRNSNQFRPYTAREIFNTIGTTTQKEAIIFNTRVRNMGTNWKMLMDPDEEIIERINVSFIRVDAFANRTSWAQRDEQIYNAINRVLN